METLCGLRKCAVGNIMGGVALYANPVQKYFVVLFDPRYVKCIGGERLAERVYESEVEGRNDNFEQKSTGKSMWCDSVFISKFYI